MEILKSIDKQLDAAFKDAPKLPNSTKEALVKVWPWLALIFGLLQLMAVWALYESVRWSNEVIDSLNSLSVYYTGQTVGPSSTDKMFLYVGIIVLLVDAVILLMAFPHLKKRAKKGWNLIFLGMILNVIYAIISPFLYGNNFGNLIFGLVGSAIGFYLLYQVKDKYTHKSA
jgi:hypothetical protein